MEDLHYEPLPNILDEIDMNEEEVNEAWAQLLEETLPPEKHPPLDREFYSKQSLRMRYSMLLEFSSYLRQGSTQRAGSDREDEEPGPRYRKGPLGSRGDDSGPPSDFLDEKYEKWLMEQQRRGKQDDTSLVWLLMRVLFIVGTVIIGIIAVSIYLGQLEDDEHRAWIMSADEVPGGGEARGAS